MNRKDRRAAGKQSGIRGAPASDGGGLFALPLILQGRGWLTGIPSEVFSSLPYVMTIVVLVIVSTGFSKRRLGAPAALGLPYVREER